MRQVLLFLFLIIIFLQLLYVTQEFNNLPNLDFNNINTVNLSMLTPIKYNKDIILQTYPKNINKVCLLGLGNGELSIDLSKNNNIIKIDCVDAEIKMFEMFKTINPNPPKKIHYYLNNINDYINKSDQKYNMIVDDTFVTEKIILDYSYLKKMLFPKGILFINSLDYNASTKLVEELNKIYTNVILQKVDLNYLITCYCSSN